MKLYVDWLDRVVIDREPPGGAALMIETADETNDLQPNTMQLSVAAGDRLVLVPLGVLLGVLTSDALRTLMRVLVRHYQDYQDGQEIPLEQKIPLERVSLVTTFAEALTANRIWRWCGCWSIGEPYRSNDGWSIAGTWVRQEMERLAYPLGGLWRLTKAEQGRLEDRVIHRVEKEINAC